MSTRSAIGIRNADGTVKAIYCHNDGYIEHNGKILLENYNTSEKIESLLALGDLSYLGSKMNPDPTKPHSFNAPQAGVVIAYHRDRGEELETACVWESVYDFTMKNPEQYDTEYLYYFNPDDGEWYVYDVCDKKKWEKLSSYFWTVKGDKA